MGSNGRVRPGYGLVDGLAVHFANCKYQLRSYQGSKTVFTSIGEHANDAGNALQRAMRRVNAVEAAANAGAVLMEESSRMNLHVALRKHCDAAEARGADEAAEVNRRAGKDFLVVTGKIYADEVTAEDVTVYLKALRKRLAPRSVTNRFRVVKSFLRSAGVQVDQVMGRAPRFEQAMPEVYEPADLGTFFASLDQGHRILFSLLLKAGLREQEAVYLTWNDVSLSAKTLQVRGKPDLKFAVKDAEERQTPLPDDLVSDLKAWHAKSPGNRFVCGTAADKPNTHMLRTLKRLVKAAGLNCGRCAACQDRQECERWFLHKFRSTYCTSLLRSGLDLRTTQSFMVHSDLESTMRYLRPAEGASVQGRVSAVSFY